MPDSNLIAAVTGPTGTFGFGLMPLLQADERIARVVGIARRPFDVSEHGWTKMAYRQGDVRDRAALEEAFEGAEVVVHLAFMITGAAAQETIRKINVEGTLNAFRQRPRRAPGDSYMPRRSPPTGSIAITRLG
jgi:nucleoside-diphosphate-sugar epimerase